jgi:hypothetical protein
VGGDWIRRDDYAQNRRYGYDDRRDHDRRDHRRGPDGDRDRDGVPNADDRDRDGDGVRNRFDRFPNNPNRS